MTENHHEAILRATISFLNGMAKMRPQEERPSAFYEGIQHVVDLTLELIEELSIMPPTDAAPPPLPN